MAHMKTLKLLFLLCSLSVFAISACGGDDVDPAVDAVLMLTGDTAMGMTQFGTSCGNSTCHGADGDEGPAPDLTVEVPARDLEGLVTVIVKGSGSMAPQVGAGGLDSQGAANVAAYSRATFQ